MSQEYFYLLYYQYVSSILGAINAFIIFKIYYKITNPLKRILLIISTFILLLTMNTLFTYILIYKYVHTDIATIPLSAAIISIIKYLASLIITVTILFIVNFVSFRKNKLKCKK